MARSCPVVVIFFVSAVVSWSLLGMTSAQPDSEFHLHPDDLPHLSKTVYLTTVTRLRCRSSSSTDAVQRSWFHNGTTVTDASLRSARIFVNSKSTLRIKKIRYSDAGSWDCLQVAKAGGGPKLWQNVTLKVETITGADEEQPDRGPAFQQPSAPTWSASMFDGVGTDDLTPRIQMKAGSTIHLKCIADGRPTPSVVWYREGVPFHYRYDGEHNQQIKTNDTLVLADLFSLDAGNYTCVVSNSEGSISHSTILSVTPSDFAPRIVPGFPHNVTTYVGKDASFECPIYDDNLFVSVSWIRGEDLFTHNFQFIADAPGSGVLGLRRDSQSLRIDNVTLNDTGVYWCLIHAAQKGIAVGNAYLNVLEKPTDPPSRSGVFETLESSPDWLVPFITVASFVVISVIIMICYLRRRDIRDERKYKRHQAVVEIQPLCRNQLYLSGAGGSNYHLSSDHSGDDYPPTVDDSGAANLINIRFIEGSSAEWNPAVQFVDIVIEGLEESEIDRSRLSLMGELGAGAFGQVLKGRLTELDGGSVLPVAVKMLKQDAGQSELRDLLRELATMKLIGHHRNIVRFIGCTIKGGPPYVVMEYCLNGNLKDFLRQHRFISDVALSKRARRRNSSIMRRSLQLGEVGRDELSPRLRDAAPFSFGSLSRNVLSAQEQDEERSGILGGTKRRSSSGSKRHKDAAKRAKRNKLTNDEADAENGAVEAEGCIAKPGSLCGSKSSNHSSTDAADRSQCCRNSRSASKSSGGSDRSSSSQTTSSPRYNQTILHPSTAVSREFTPVNNTNNSSNATTVCAGEDEITPKGGLNVTDMSDLRSSMGDGYIQPLAANLVPPLHLSNGVGREPTERAPLLQEDDSFELETKLSGQDEFVLSESVLLRFCHEIASGLEFLTSRGCMHRDIAARNILVSGDFVMKISDFGLSRHLSKNNSEEGYYRKTTAEGRMPIKWLSPEALSDRKYSTKSDVWSFGVLCWEVCSLGMPPYPALRPSELPAFLDAGHRMGQPAHADNSMYQLMLDCWLDRPELRPNFSMIADRLAQMRRTKEEVLAAVCRRSLGSDSVYSSANSASLEAATAEAFARKLYDGSNEQQSQEATLLRYASLERHTRTAAAESHFHQHPTEFDPHSGVQLPLCNIVPAATDACQLHDACQSGAVNSRAGTLDRQQLQMPTGDRFGSVRSHNFVPPHSAHHGSIGSHGQEFRNPTHIATRFMSQQHFHNVQPEDHNHNTFRGPHLLAQSPFHISHQPFAHASGLEAESQAAHISIGDVRQPFSSGGLTLSPMEAQRLYRGNLADLGILPAASHPQQFGYPHMAQQLSHTDQLPRRNVERHLNPSHEGARSPDEHSLGTDSSWMESGGISALSTLQRERRNRLTQSLHQGQPLTRVYENIDTITGALPLQPAAYSINNNMTIGSQPDEAGARLPLRRQEASAARPVTITRTNSDVPSASPHLRPNELRRELLVSRQKDAADLLHRHASPRFAPNSGGSLESAQLQPSMSIPSTQSSARSQGSHSKPKSPFSPHTEQPLGFTVAQAHPHLPTPGARGRTRLLGVSSDGTATPPPPSVVWDVNPDSVQTTV